MKSLYLKFVVVTIGIMFFSGISAFLLSNYYYQQNLKPANDLKITGIAESIAVFTASNPNVSLGNYLENIASVGYQLYLVDQSGKGSFFGAPFRDNSLSSQIKQQVLEGNMYHGILHFPQQTFVTGFFANELKNTIGVPLNHNGERYALFVRPDIKLLFHEMQLLFAWLLGFTIVLSTIMVVISTNYLIKPISKLTKATKSLASGNFAVELNTTNRDELGELSRSFLQMARKLEQMEEMRKEFISNISHDIQSPLSNIKGYINLLENELVGQKERGQYFSIINSEIKRLSVLTKQLLLLASLDRDVDILKIKPVNVGQQIKELVRNYQWLVSEKGIMLSYNLPDTTISGDPSLLHTVWDNLLSNAIKYNKPDGSIDISIEKSGESIFVTFEDTGIGMNRAEVERIFDRFYRADIARTRTIEGTGLGLSIVWTIIKLHQGQITVNSNEKQGTTITIELPIGM